MRYPQVVIYDSDDWLATQVAEVARENGWLVRESRQADACLQLLREARPSVVLLKLGPKALEEMTLLSRLTRHVPDCPVVLVSDAKLDVAGRHDLVGLAYDLGARYVLMPPLTRSVIEDVVVGLLEATIQRQTMG